MASFQNLSNLTRRQQSDPKHLSNVDWYNIKCSHKLANNYYLSDDEEDLVDCNGEVEHATEADEDEDDDVDDLVVTEHDREQESRERSSAKLRSGYGGERIAPASTNHISSYFPSQTVSGRPFPPITSPGRNFNTATRAVTSSSRDGKKMERRSVTSPSRNGKKTERVSAAYPSPLPHSGNLLPHSSPLKLHVNMHHVGSHSGSHNLKSTATMKSFLIPSNAPGRVKRSGFANANEPSSSPQVTCLGRIKIKQRYCKEMAKLASLNVKAQVEDEHDPDDHPTADLTWKKKLRRNKTKASKLLPWRGRRRAHIRPRRLLCKGPNMM